MSNDVKNSNELTSYDDFMLTTIDNPFNPFEDFKSWLMFDKEKGYNTCEKLARIAVLPDNLSEKEKNDEIDRAMDEIIKHDFLEIYIKVAPNNT